jgi:excisionase family DNA binding protein
MRGNREKADLKPATVNDAALDAVSGGFTKVADAAKFLGISRSKCYAMMEAGILPFALFGKSRRIPVRALNEYAARSLVGA